jgi:hypothetical protein
MQAKTSDETLIIKAADDALESHLTASDTPLEIDRDSDTSAPLKETLSAPLNEIPVVSMQLDEPENEEILTEHDIPDSPQLVEVLPIETAPQEPVEPKLKRYGRKVLGSKKVHVTERKKSLESLDAAQATPDNLQPSVLAESSDETYSQLRKRKTIQAVNQSDKEAVVEAKHPDTEKELEPPIIETSNSVKKTTSKKSNAPAEIPAEPTKDDIVASGEQRFDEHTKSVAKPKKSRKKKIVQNEVLDSIEKENPIVEETMLTRRPRAKAVPKLTVLDNVQTEEDDIIQQVEAPIVKEPQSKQRKRSRTASDDPKVTNLGSVKVMFTGIAENDEHRLIVQRLSGSEVETWQDCTHLVTDKIRRTTKFLCSLSAGKHIVDLKWLSDSQKQGKFISDTSKYLLKDGKTEKQYSMNLKSSLKKTADKASPKLFAGVSIYATPNLKPPSKELFEILEAAGGKLLIKPPNSIKSNVYICGTTQDESECKKLKRLGYKIYSNELILTSILRQEIDLAR